MIEKIFKLAKVEAEWISHYGHEDSRRDEQFEDFLFYDRMQTIGYAKVYTPLYLRCPMGFINSLDINSITEIIYGPRNHKNNVYTCLEFVIYNKIEGYEKLINLIKTKKYEY